MDLNTVRGDIANYPLPWSKRGNIVTDARGFVICEAREPQIAAALVRLPELLAMVAPVDAKSQPVDEVEIPARPSKKKR